MQSTQNLHKCRPFVNTDSINKISFPVQSVKETLAFQSISRVSWEIVVSPPSLYGCAWFTYVMHTIVIILRSNTIFDSIFANIRSKYSIWTPVPTLCNTYSRSFGLKICFTHHRRLISDLLCLTGRCNIGLLCYCYPIRFIYSLAPSNRV